MDPGDERLRGRKKSEKLLCRDGQLLLIIDRSAHYQVIGSGLQRVLSRESLSDNAACSGIKHRLTDEPIGIGSVSHLKIGNDRSKRADLGYYSKTCAED
ncbi:MAG: hypothetical protein A4E49_00812 [Methanosaeta sp. PtaU1.Bin112]|nr:MAG: hypothetical protein A4E49_00812 [Methanosaeta sp. PtaU1.Bin112]